MWILISKMDVKMKIRIITKNHTADSKISSPQKIDFRAVGTQESHPAAWELKVETKNQENPIPDFQDLSLDWDQFSKVLDFDFLYFIMINTHDNFNWGFNCLKFHLNFPDLLCLFNRGQENLTSIIFGKNECGMKILFLRIIL